MIVTRTPMRISYVGGGSDFPSHFMNNFGSVIGATINQYVYVYANPLSEVAPEKIRFTYRKTESVDQIGMIEHPVLREMLLEMDWDSKLNLGTFSELPAGVGLGGSSSFTVGLANLLLNLRGIQPTPEITSEIAIKVEREILAEKGGHQDQLHAAYGGFRHYYLDKSGVKVSNILIPDESSELISQQQILVWTGKSRNSSEFAEATELFARQTTTGELNEISKLSLEVKDKLVGASSPEEHFEILVNGVAKSWELKKAFTNSTDEIVDEIIQLGILNGARASKLCGAGGSGFVLLLCDQSKIEKLSSALRGFKIIKPRIVNEGSKMIFRDYETI